MYFKILIVFAASIYNGLCESSEEAIRYPVERSLSKIIYNFYDRKHVNKKIGIRMETVHLLRSNNFDPNKETLFVVHGWDKDNTSHKIVAIERTVLVEHDINVFSVDWRYMATLDYVSARNSVVKVGRQIARFILKLIQDFGLKLSKINFVGHSLGAHVCGNAGAALGGMVKSIVGLDPAGPLFNVRHTEDRLDPTDAKFVQVIHTCGGILSLGFPSSLGHVDYYPNGGKLQPGCKWDLTGICSHARSYDYYVESLRDKYRYIAKKCHSYSAFSRGECLLKQTNLMGRFHMDFRAKGDYYLFTNEFPPFARGRKMD